MNWNLIWVQVGTNWNETGRKGRGEKVGSVEGEKGGRERREGGKRELEEG